MEETHQPAGSAGDLPSREQAGAQSSEPDPNQKLAQEQAIEQPPEIPTYRSHKEVRALKIRKIGRKRVDGHTLAALVPEDERFEAFAMPDEWMLRHMPQAPGYYVLYADGYESWSPVEQFEAGYTLLEDEQQPGASQ